MRSVTVERQASVLINRRSRRFEQTIMDVHEVHLQLCFDFRCLTLYISGFDLLVQNARRGRSSLFLAGTLSIVIVSPRLAIIRSSTIIIFGCLLLQVSTSEIAQKRFGAVAGYS